MSCSLQKEQTSIYIQHDGGLEYSMGVKLCESASKDSSAILRFTVSPVDNHQELNESYLHEQAVSAVYIDDAIIIDGFKAYLQESKVNISTYHLELLSQNKTLIWNVAPALSEQGDLRMLCLMIQQS